MTSRHMLVIILVLLITGCSLSNEYLVSEFSKYTDTINNDGEQLNRIMDKYDNLNPLDLDNRITVLNEYIDYYNIMTNHLTSFEVFIKENEIPLRRAGVNTYETKMHLQDANAGIMNNINGMKRDVEQIIEQQKLTQKQQQEAFNLLGSLVSLLI